MSKSIKRILALGLSSLLLVGCLTACSGEQEGSEPPATTEAAPLNLKETKSLKILTLGHSLTVDSCYMLAAVAAAEGYEDLTVGTLYYSGCPLNRHVAHLKANERAYTLYISKTKESPNSPPEQMKDVTMEDALRFDKWDIIIMQGGTFEIAQENTFTAGHIQIIQQYVNDNKLNPNAIFAWHMPWAFATDPDLMNSYTASTNNPYISGYLPYNNDRLKLYNEFTKCVEKYILPDETFQVLIPSGTAIENAMSSYLDEKDLLRDYAHATDLGRVIAAYTWYCVLSGTEQLEEIKFDTIPKTLFKTTAAPVDWPLTDAEKAIIIESVNNALKNPLQQTQSQYTTAPTA